jgi:hypothetical protein
VTWGPTPAATFTGPVQLPVAEFDSIYPCVPPGSRNCIPQPDTTQRIDILSYRQRPTWRLAYRNFGTHESLVTSQAVEARPGIAGMRWYELRRPGNEPIVYQQGTYAPADDLNRWMGSVAYTGRLRNDVPNQMPQGEGSVIEGSGSQTDPAARWGDYTSMNIDPVHGGAGTPPRRRQVASRAPRRARGTSAAAGSRTSVVGRRPSSQAASCSAAISAHSVKTSSTFQPM